MENPNSSDTPKPESQTNRSSLVSLVAKEHLPIFCGWCKSSTPRQGVGVVCVLADLEKKNGGCLVILVCVCNGFYSCFIICLFYILAGLRVLESSFFVFKKSSDRPSLVSFQVSFL